MKNSVLVLVPEVDVAADALTPPAPRTRFVPYAYALMLVGWKWLGKFLFGIGALAVANIRLQSAKTPEERLAVVAIEAVQRMRQHHGRDPDYLELARAFRPHVVAIQAQAAVDENEVALRLELMKRREELLRTLALIRYPDEF